MNKYIINYGHPTVQKVLLQSFGCNSNPYTILIQTIVLQAFLIFVSFLSFLSPPTPTPSPFFSFFFSPVFPFKDSCTTFTAKKQKYLLIHPRENERFQGVEFTEISCGRGELGWSKCDGMTSCCKALRATVSCANDGRKFGSLGINRQEEKPIKLDLFSKGVIINGVCYCSYFFYLRLPTLPNYASNHGIHFLGDVKATILETYCTHHLHWIHSIPR
jgi:hypothetical protein